MRTPLKCGRLQVLALHALTGMAALLLQRFSAAGGLDADLAALEARDLPPDQRLATMLVANKKRVLATAAQDLAGAFKARFCLIGGGSWSSTR